MENDMIYSKIKQRGSALIVSLLILLVLTIIGVTALNSTVMEEKMTSNFQTGNTAYQAAESAVNQTFANIANSFNLVQLAIDAQDIADANDSDPVWPTTPQTVLSRSQSGADPNANDQSTLNSTVSYVGTAHCNGFSTKFIGYVVNVEGRGTVANVNRANAAGITKCGL